MAKVRNCLLDLHDLIRPLLLKVGQYDPIKMKMDSLEVIWDILHMLPPKGIPYSQ